MFGGKGEGKAEEETLHYHLYPPSPSPPHLLTTLCAQLQAWLEGAVREVCPSPPSPAPPDPLAGRGVYLAA